MSVDLLKPIPDYTRARFKKEQGYRAIPIDISNPRYTEPLVPIADYGIAGASYYSRPNFATGDPVEGVSPDIYGRKRVVEKLADVNDFLQTDDIIAFLLGGRVQLGVDDAWRDPFLQKMLRETVIPDYVRRLHADDGWTEEQVMAEAHRQIATPEWSEQSVPPHLTGGETDLTMTFLDSGELVDIAKDRRILGEDAKNPEFLEVVDENFFVVKGLGTALYRNARIARRILHNLMTTEEVGGIAAAVNPIEAWHYSYGDQLWAQVTGAPNALYGFPTVLPDGVGLDPRNSQV